MSNRGRHKKTNKHLIVQILGSKIADRIMECQKEQNNCPNLDIFLKEYDASVFGGGFTWRNTKEGHLFWREILANKLIEHPLYKRYKNERR